MAQYTPTANFSVSSGTYTPTADFDLRSATELSLSANAVIIAAVTRQASADSAIVEGKALSGDLDSAINPAGLSSALSAVLIALHSASANANAAIQQGQSAESSLDAAVVPPPVTLEADTDAVVVLGQAASSSVSAVIQEPVAANASLDAALQGADQVTISTLLEAALLSAIVPPGDTNTLILLHCDGADQSQTFTDETGRSWTTNGATKQVTAQYKYGTASGEGATSGYLLTAADDDLNFTGEFTAEGWFRFYDTTRRALFGASVGDTGSWCVYRNSSYIYFTIGAQLVASRSATFNTSDWFHIAVTRDASNVCKVWVNGVGSTAGNYTTNANAINSNGGLVVGRNATWHADSPTWWRGHFDEVRVSNTCRYTEDFTPPAQPFTLGGIPNTLLSLSLNGGVWKHWQLQSALTAALGTVRKHACFPDAWLLGVDATARALRARIDANLLPGDDMSLSFSTGLRNHMLGYYARQTGDGLGAAMHNCFIDVYEGTKPNSPDYPPTASIFLGTFQLSENPYNDEWGGSWEDPSAASIRKTTWQNWVMAGMRTGTAGWFRMRLIDDLNNYSTTAHRIDGTIGTTPGEYDLVMQSTAINHGGMYRIDSFVMTMRMEN